MPSINDVFGGTALKADDIRGKSPTVRIKDVTLKEFNDPEKGLTRKLFLTFDRASKGLVVNSTNAHRIADLYGHDYSQWAGHDVRLQVDRVDFKGKTVDAIRVYPPGTAAPVAPPPQKSIQDDMDDVIPF